jgi:parallel beta-helix repeat protein
MASRFTILIAALAAVALSVPGSAAALTASECDLVVATNGNDLSSGSASEPLLGSDRAVERLADGQTLCFRSGTYQTTKGLSIKAAHATITSYPGERAILLGSLRIERPATGTVVENLVLNGRNPGNYFNPLIYADGAVLRNNEITNDHTTNCVHVSVYYDEPAPRDVVVEDNDIHDCGVLPAANHQHGIYVGASVNMIIRNNRIWDNADRGIQLWPDAQNTQIYGNVIDGNGQGLAFGGYQGDATSDTLVEHNLITNSNARHNVEASWDETAVGGRNIVRDNCIFHAEGWYDERDGSGIASPQVGFDATDNIIADPQYVDRASGNFELEPGSACEGVLGGQPATIRPPPARAAQIALRASRRTVPAGSMTRLRGRVPTRAGGVVSILRLRKGNWNRIGRARVRDFRFTMRTKIKSRSKFKARAVGARDSRALKITARAPKR